MPSLRLRACIAIFARLVRACFHDVLEINLMLCMNCCLWLVVHLWSRLGRQFDWVPLNSIRIASIISITTFFYRHLIITLMCKINSLTHTHGQGCTSRLIIEKSTATIYIVIINRSSTTRKFVRVLSIAKICRLRIHVMLFGCN